MKGKRGQVGVTEIILGLLVLFIFIVLGLAAYNTINGGDSWYSSLSNSIDSVSNGFMAFLGPLFSGLLNFGSDSDVNFLMVLTFILVSIVVVGTLDSVNIFGDNNKGNMINLAVGIIVAILGVRFMPADMWISLTAPSSAFVATLLVGAPFLALFFVTMKIKYPLANKLLWLFYLIFMSYLIFFPASLDSDAVARDQISPGGMNDFIWIYVIFLVLAIAMMFLDSTVRKYILKEKVKGDLQHTMYKKGILSRKELRDEMKEWSEIVSDPDASKEEKTEAKKMKKELTQLIKDTATS